MLRTAITVNQTRFYLAQGQDPAGLRTAMIDAVHGGGAFVRFTEVGNRKVEVLVSPGVSIIFEEDEVEADDRDTGDVDHPFIAPADARRGYIDFDFDFSG
ncbi:hypothetical protein CLV46_2618 [Diaminobutyricimonas aerilata]|uniref:Uncharacterized protein n=1 Tax=Diaminobutyricimonas aerilata TaxID=1162967 RepID=A0A2M9CMA0_9MICO|nr:hypothetical protein [Diaminobutyricimonas aerilata]PJJ73037.1 hypothetical protein CLV46_2618 [Diaminobutyricimonas aerilata]